MDQHSLVPLIEALAQGTQFQQITYPCDCTLTGRAPLPATCPTHDTQPAAPEILVSVVLDESGSMTGIRQKTIDGFNEYLHGLRQDGNRYLFTLTKFDSAPASPTCRIVYQNKQISEVPLLDAASYAPRGGTPLCDAVGETITALKQSADGQPVLMIVLTDGEENASHTWNKDKVRELIRGCEATGKWTFVFLGANQDAWSEAHKLGFSQGNVANFAVQNVNHVMHNLVGATRNYRLGVSKGMSCTSSYFGDAGITDINVPGGTNAGQIASYLGSQGGLASASRLTPKERKERASNAVKARWAKNKA